MGLGLFATRDIKMGELIFAERPLIITPCNIGLITLYLPNVESQHDAKTTLAIVRFEWEKKLELALGKMTPDDQAAFTSLANCHKEDGSGPLLGISRTNGFGIDDLFDGEPKHLFRYTGVGKLGSCINHRSFLFLF